MENQCKKEYYKDYNNFILCEEIVYKCYDVIPEKILNISTIQKPFKKYRKNKKSEEITEKNIESIEKEEKEEIVEERESIFVQKVIKYKEIERKKYGNVFKSPIKSPITPSKNELVISTLSPFSTSTRNFYKAKQRRLNLFSPEQSYKERRERREKEIFDKNGIEKEKEKDNLISTKIIESNNFEVRKIIINIPKCPKSLTVDYLKDIRKPCLKTNIIDNINSIPNREIICRNKIPDKRFYPKIYKSLKKTQNLVDFHLQFLKEVPHHSFNRILPNKIYNIINDTNKKLALMQIFYIYAHYKYDKYLIKKIYWNRWKKEIKLFNVTINSNDITHLKNIAGHCFSMERIVVKEIRCGIHPNSSNFMDCLCLRTKISLKRIILRHYLLKIIDKKKYYLFEWYKKALKKIRPIYL